MPLSLSFQALAIGTILVTTALALWTNPDKGADSGSGEALFLTPLITKGQVQKAKEKCRVEKVAGMDFESYSGYLTVRGPPDDANLFFWFFPAVNNSANAPILLSMGGGPGESSLRGLFTENGPYNASSNYTIVPRTNHWLSRFSIIYLDAPVGSGFSFANSSASYCKNMTTMCNDLLEALQQFFTLFYEYTTNDFYIMGESYGGKAGAALAQRLHQVQSNASDGALNRLNLKGVICVGSPLTFNPHFLGVVDFYYTNGLLTEKQYNLMEQMEQQFLDAVASDDVYRANTYVQQYFTNLSSPFIYHFTLFTGFTSYLNLAYSYEPSSFHDYEQFVTQADVRKAIHVGPQTFHKSVNKEVILNVDDMVVGVLPALENILDLGYRVLLMYGTSDMVVVPLAAQDFASSLQWKGSDQFNATTRLIWKLEGDQEVAGYVTPGQDLWFVAVRNAGHILFRDQPQASFDILTHFTTNNSTF